MNAIWTPLEAIYLVQMENESPLDQLRSMNSNLFKWIGDNWLNRTEKKTKAGTVESYFHLLHVTCKI